MPPGGFASDACSDVTVTSLSKPSLLNAHQHKPSRVFEHIPSVDGDGKRGRKEEGEGGGKQTELSCHVPPTTSV